MRCRAVEKIALQAARLDRCSLLTGKRPPRSARSAQCPPAGKIALRRLALIDALCRQERAVALVAALAAVALVAALVAAAAVALVAALAAALAAVALIAVLAAACCLGVDSGGDLESWASRGTLGLAWALRVKAGPVGLGFASL